MRAPRTISTQGHVYKEKIIVSLAEKDRRALESKTCSIVKPRHLGVASWNICGLRRPILAKPPVGS